jgi:thiamine-phosphate pyrophosphorylase
MRYRGKKAEAERAAPRLYLVSPQVSDPAGLADMFAGALAAADVAAVWLRISTPDERVLVNHVKALSPAIQERGAALLLDGYAELVARAGADGAHLTGADALLSALASLKPDRIAGCGGLMSRDDAMVVAEAGADYVMFGEPDAAGRRPSFDAIVDRVAWWAQVFEVPCVGFAGAPDEVEPLAAAGADFVAVGDWAFRDARGCAAALADAARRLAVAEAAA